MHLANFPRRRYTPGPTPMELLARLSSRLNGPEIWMKRDDLTGLSPGGNKTRKLEFLVAQALAQECDTLITVGAVQSNHCRLTSAAAAKEGLKCRLVVEQHAATSHASTASSDNLLIHLFGAESLRFVDTGVDPNQLFGKIVEDLERIGRKGYVIPRGGSTPLGALGYVACAEEILAQSFDLGIAFDHVVCASGSGGTQAGLILGFERCNAAWSVTGISVKNPRAEQETIVRNLTHSTANLLRCPIVPPDVVRVFDDWVGRGYALPTDATIAAVRLIAQLEGILLDPIYTGKAMAGLIDLIRRGRLKRGEKVLFVHTGGSPALYAYQSALMSGKPANS